MDINIDTLFFMFFGECIDNLDKKGLEEQAHICAVKAYRDVCRTIKYDGTDSALIEEAKNSVLAIISKSVKNLQDDSIDFDEWHRELCEKIKNSFNEIIGKAIFHIGQAQKWVNMTLKYLRLMGIDFGDIDKNMHIPVDNYIIDAAAIPLGRKICEEMNIEGLGVTFQPGKPWSVCEDYDKYLEFQEEIRRCTGGKQIEWEDKAWISMAIINAG